MSTIQESWAVLLSLLGPWKFMYMSLTYLPSTVRQLVQEGNFRTLFSWPLLRGAWFSKFWAWVGPGIRQGRGERLTALLQGRISAGSVVPEQVVSPIGGIVLDIGPGPGYWVDIYSPFNTPEKQLKIYGVEPNPDVHASLSQRVEAAGIKDVYRIVPAGIQSLSSLDQQDNDLSSIAPGSVDCIVSFLCLCSIPEPEKNIRELHRYLKKGGRWYLFEHVQVKATWLKPYQRFVNIFWPQALNGCQLCRNTEKTLREAGDWERIDLTQPSEEPWHQVVPHILGFLQK
ncbi:methyltransferase [Stachybotrys elegans]|uniref:Methyltransferase n=1 Tax=Stachybotrys elegans TaxID=80388 RepID=A0A8K0SLN4_9HYPO|nr:methyltransferase [Stachybotrys elegans]